MYTLLLCFNACTRRTPKFSSKFQLLINRLQACTFTVNGLHTSECSYSITTPMRLDPMILVLIWSARYASATKTMAAPRPDTRENVTEAIGDAMYGSCNIRINVGPFSLKAVLTHPASLLVLHRYTCQAAGCG